MHNSKHYTTKTLKIPNRVKIYSNNNKNISENKIPIKIYQDSTDTHIINNKNRLLIYSDNNESQIIQTDTLDVQNLIANNMETTDMNVVQNLNCTSVLATCNIESVNIGSKNINTDSIFTNNANIINSNMVTGIIKQNLTICENLMVAGVVETSVINSLNDLTLSTAPGAVIRATNISYAVNSAVTGVLDPPILKSFKIFVCTSNVILNADTTCDGLEIIIYNHNAKAEISISFPRFLTKIPAKCAKKFIYICVANQWIVI